MESKIIQVINKMVENSNLISDVIPGYSIEVTEYFFLYNIKHRWSILITKSGDFNLFYYTTEMEIRQIAILGASIESFVKYSSIDLKSREAVESYAALFKIVQEKVHGMDSIFNDILSE